MTMRKCVAAVGRLLTLLVLVAAGAAIATATQPGGEKSAKTKELPALTPERETAALAFVRQNHAELAELLAQLKTSNPTEYERAIRQLYQNSETLAQMQSRDPKRYELDLHAWKVNSRIQLLTARLTMSPTPAMQDELKAAIAEQFDVRLRTLQLERERLASRLEKVNASIQNLEQNRDQQAEAQLTRILRSADSSRAKTKANPASGEKKKREKSGQK